MNCPRPERLRSHSAICTATAASAPACRPVCGRLTRNGARSESPLCDIGPADAATVTSLANHPAFGPLEPNGVIAT